MGNSFRVDNFTFEAHRADISISMCVAGYQSHKPRVGSYLAGGFAGEVSFGETRREEFWGYCGVKDPETIYCHGLSYAVDHALPHVRLPPSIHAFLVSDGFAKNLRKYVPAWIERHGLTTSGKKPDAYEVRLRCYHLIEFGGTKIDVLTPMRGNLAGLKQEAEKIAEVGFKRGATRHSGILNSGIGFDHSDLV